MLEKNLITDVLNKINEMNSEEAKEYLRNLPEEKRYLYRRYIENSKEENYIKPIF